MAPLESPRAEIDTITLLAQGNPHVHNALELVETDYVECTGYFLAFFFRIRTAATREFHINVRLECNCVPEGGYEEIGYCRLAGSCRAGQKG